MYLNLLVPSTDAISQHEPIITVAGQPLILTTIEGDWRNTPYTCVSFAWGKDRVPNPFNKDSHISARAIPVLQTAVAHAASVMKTPGSFAIWMDIFCIPDEAALKAMYLRSMGEIYAHAAQVMVVLSSNMTPLLQAIRNGTGITDEALLLLETDEWVTRAWTYQEIVNSGTIYFIAEGEDEAPVVGSDFFDAIAKAIEPFSKAKQYDAFTMQATYPGLTSFEAVVLDWRIAEYQERSAYQVMTNMCYRTSDQAHGLIYAMIGCIAGNQPQGDSPATISPAEQFMQVCEAKGDFSYIYSTAARSTEPNKSWRPNDGTFRPVLPWLYCYGEAQAGALHDDCLTLDNVGVLQPGTIAAASIDAIMHIMTYNGAQTSVDNIDYILQCLQTIGFTGCGQHIELENGYFFPQTLIDDLTDIQLIAATGIRWTFGAPGLLLKPMNGALYSYVGVGVFVGTTIEPLISIKIV